MQNFIHSIHLFLSIHLVFQPGTKLMQFHSEVKHTCKVSLWGENLRFIPATCNIRLLIKNEKIFVHKLNFNYKYL